MKRVVRWSLLGQHSPAWSWHFRSHLAGQHLHHDSLMSPWPVAQTSQPGPFRCRRHLKTEQGAVN
jgi:hypothetical protein